MTKFWRNAAHHEFRSRATESSNASNPSKGTVIAIAAVATVLVLALIAAGIFFFFRRRSRKSSAKRHDRFNSLDRDGDSLIDSVSKTPLMRQENQSQSEHRTSPTPKYDGDSDMDLTMLAALRRSFSGVSLQSLPPSYTAAINRPNGESDETTTRTGSNARHDRDGNGGGSDGLRPLMLIAAQNEQDIAEQKGQDGQDSLPDRLSLIPSRPGAGRARAGSRFREEDLDI